MNKYVAERIKIVMDRPHAGPSAEWKRWNDLLQRRVVSHPCFACRSMDWSEADGRKWSMLLRASVFLQSMMMAANFAAWNPRNPSPFLP